MAVEDEASTLLPMGWGLVGVVSVAVAEAVGIRTHSASAFEMLASVGGSRASAESSPASELEREMWAIAVGVVEHEDEFEIVEQ